MRPDDWQTMHSQGQLDLALLKWGAVLWNEKSMRADQQYNEG
jgi:hypothetical protein